MTNPASKRNTFDVESNPSGAPIVVSPSHDYRLVRAASHRGLPGLRGEGVPSISTRNPSGRSFRSQHSHRSTADQPERRSILIADDNPRFREDLAALLERDYEVLATADNGKQLVELALKLRPDPLVVDVSMPVMSGLEAVDHLSLRGVHSKVVMLSSQSDPAYVQRAFRVGASGYVLKGASFEDLPRALVAVSNGERFVSEGIELE